MSYKLVKEIIGGVWAIRPSDMNNLLPYVGSLLSGMNVDMSEFRSEEQQSEINPINTNKRISIIPIKGVITKYTNCGPMGLVDIEKTLKAIDSKGLADAIILDIDSPGGEASYLANISATIRNMSIPVVSHYSGLCCSAAYYVASNSQSIFASAALDTVGSIGTVSFLMAQNPDKKDPEIVTHAIYADKSTDKNKMFREAIAGRYELIKSKELNPFNEAFHQNVLSGREGVSESVLTGDTYKSEEAIKLGLIDGIKTMDEVIQYTLNLLANPDSEKLKFNFKIKNQINMKSYFEKVSAIIGREVTSFEGITAEEFVAINAATGSKPGEGAGPVFINSEDLQSTVSAAVANAMQGFQPAMTTEQITEAINSSVATAVAAEFEKRPAGTGADAGAVEGGGEGKVVESWEDPNNPVNKYLDSQM